jgi:hypothetical protein
MVGTPGRLRNGIVRDDVKGHKRADTRKNWNWWSRGWRPGRRSGDVCGATLLIVTGIGVAPTAQRLRSRTRKRKRWVRSVSEREEHARRQFVMRRRVVRRANSVREMPASAQAAHTRSAVASAASADAARRGRGAGRSALPRYLPIWASSRASARCGRCRRATSRARTASPGSARTHRRRRGDLLRMMVVPAVRQAW